MNSDEYEELHPLHHLMDPDYDYENDFDRIHRPYQVYRKRQNSLRRSDRLSHYYQPNYPYVLIIIDMQDEFISSRNSSTISNVQRMINEARRDGAFIVAAHYLRCGQTRPEIKSLFEDYDRKAYCYADQNDKSGAILTKLNSHQVRTNTFKVCGVNTCACVEDTILGLIRHYPDSHIMVSRSSCNCSCDEYECNGHSVGQYPNVSFVY